jgi:hypothetical protein
MHASMMPVSWKELAGLYQDKRLLGESDWNRREVTM